ncbi:NAD-dependent epimerase/dehydratase family protein [Alloscardovia theropitheci]|uniref:NAD-dependent epimerase/dehydratase family protein n=1 Tax=Alloscardovia theropitheci TaxID=2496842 RepID=A0A4R0QWH3_9BIFI|nr:NAD(P)H-binding protein [Alloscardovia theropitheci]TCD53611.1 NAD-dependent epimerase/dehydratase family protein [Alloscardovia theropitheci]
MKKVLILGANGQIARIVEKRLLNEYDDVDLTLYLRNSSRVKDIVDLDTERVHVIDADIHDQEALNAAISGQDIVFISNVDHDSDNALTQGVIDAMKKAGVSRVIAANVLGIYDEVPGEFGRWNTQMLTRDGLKRALRSDQILEESGLDYTTLRLPWLNDRDEIDYVITHKGEEYVGVSGSRQSMADVVVKIVSNPDYLSRESIGIANSSTQGSDRPVY